MVTILRRILAGLILVWLGIVLYLNGSSGTSPERTVLTLALVVVWCGCGIAVLAGLGRARILGLGLSLAGSVAGLVLATQGIDSPRVLLDVVFAPQDAGRWYVVMPIGWMFAILSGIAAALLVSPFPPWVASR